MTDTRHAKVADTHRRRITEQAASWYLDQRREELSASAQQAFLEWLKQSPVHVGEYLAIARLHSDLRAAASMETMDASALRILAADEPAIVTLHQGRETPPVQDQRHARHETPRCHRPRPWLAAAGVAAALIFAAGALLLAPFRQPRGDVYTSTHGEGRDLTLPDGSLIQLDRDSAIAVNFDARFRRIDMLHGRALFDVGKDPQRPLQVRVGAHVLRDIGTVFAVRRSDTDADVTVVSGRVDVMSPMHPWLDALDRRLGRSVAPAHVVADLGGGEQALLTADGAVTSTDKPVDIERATAWLPADIAFHDSPVGDVARRFNAHTATPLVIDDARIAGMRISGRFRARDIDAFVAYLASLPGVRVQRQGTQVQILAEAPSKHAHRRL
jgi:transmembrane sensor